MTIKLTTRTVLHCKCRHCGHEWDTFEKPKRCSRCKKYSWNGEDYRRTDPYELVPHGSIIGEAPPDPPQYRQVLDALVAAKVIIEQIIADIGPCEHAKKICVCEEIAVRNKVDKQIEALKRYLPAAAAKNGAKTSTEGKSK